MPRVKVRGRKQTMEGDNLLHLLPSASKSVSSESFDVFVSTVGANSGIEYRIYDPSTQSWGNWLAGADGGVGGITSNINDSVADPLETFPTTENALADSIVTSEVLLISSSGYLLQLRRRSSILEGAIRSVNAQIGEFVRSWSVVTAQAEDPVDPPISSNDPRLPYWPVPVPTPLPSGSVYSIATGTSSFDGNSNGVGPGAIINIDGGARGPLTIQNVFGSEANPVLIRNNPNSPSRVQITGSGNNGWYLNFHNCQNFIVDGLFPWVGAPNDPVTYGIHVTGNPNNTPPNATNCPGAYVRAGGTATKFKMRGISIDGNRESYVDKIVNVSTGIGSGIGLYVNDHATTRDQLLFRENIIVEYCFIRQVRAEAMYIGPNFNDTRVALRNIKVRYNWCEYTGWDGVNVKFLVGGLNQFNNNVMLYQGLAGNIGQQGEGAGLSPPFEVFNNFVYRPAMQGLMGYLSLPVNYVYTGQGQSFDPLPALYIAYNNVIVESGYDPAAAKTSQGTGLTANRRTDTSDELNTKFYNNTVIRPLHSGIRIGSSLPPGEVRNNIVCEAGSTALIFGSAANSNNTVDTVASQNFVDAAAQNYRLTSSSPAKDTGTTQLYSATDFDNRTRPQGTTVDRGAFELEQ